MPTIQRRAAIATWWSALEIFARYGVQFVVMVILARLLSPDDFGIVAMLLIFTSIGALLVDSGFGTALIQRQVSSDDDQTTVFIFTTIVGVAIAGVMLIAAPAIASFFDEPKLNELTRVMAIVLPLGAMAAVPDAVLTAKLEFRSRAQAEAIASLCAGTVSITLAIQGFGVWSLAWQGVVSIGVRATSLWILSGWRPRGRYRHQSFVSLFGFGGYLLLTSLLNVIAVRMQSLLIGKFFDAHMLGLYTLAQNTQQAPSSIVDNLLKRVGLPVFSAIANEPVKLRSALRASIRMAMFLYFPCMIGIALVAEPLIGLLYGARWTPAAPILSILALSAALWPIHVLNLAAIAALGRSDLLLRVEVPKQLVGISLIAAFAYWGPVAIAWAVLLSSLYGVAINTYYTQKLLAYAAVAQVRDQSATFLLAFAAAIVGWLTLHHSDRGSISMFLSILSAAVTYTVLAIVSRNEAMGALLSILRSRKEA